MSISCVLPGSPIQLSGAVAKCNFGHCQCYFHPLCARRAGNYLVARVQPGSKQLRYRLYCHNHSEAQRNKDIQSGAAARVRGMPKTVAVTVACVSSKHMRVSGR